MAVASDNSIDPPYNCYKVPDLINSILETHHISYIEDRYVFGEELGWGQFGVIRACSDMLTGESVACKSISKDRLVTPDDIRSIKLEIEVMARLSGHPNIVDLKAVYEDSDHVYIVMELCAGGELFHRLEKHGCFSEHEAADIFRHLMEVVMYCHEKGVIHRDLKPENILLANRSLSSPIKLADFGLATYITPGQSLNGTVGSPFYIAPEVLSGGYNEAADVWSAGVILYILLSGTPPFWGKTKSKIFEAVRSAELRFPSDQWDKVSHSAKELIKAMLCRDQSHRATARQVLDHSWLRKRAQDSNVLCEQCNAIRLTHRETGSSLFSSRLTSASRDVSFSTSSPVHCHTEDHHSSVDFTRSSLLFSFNVDTRSPTINFSFRNSCESTTLGMSFAFFSSSSEQEPPLDLMTNELTVDPSKRDSRTSKILMSSNLVSHFDREPGESQHKGPEARKGAAASSKVFAPHSRRNNTIGLGEFVQLDLVVSESVIRWASCTHLPNPPSLRSSLVC